MPFIQWAAPRHCCSLLLGATLALSGCDRASEPPAPATPSEESAASALPDEPSPVFRNVEQPTAYVGDKACSSCHAAEASTYHQHAMAQSFHKWTPATRIEKALDTPLYNKPTGYSYTIAEQGGQLYQVEYLNGPDGKRMHELRRRMDYVMGSGHVARTYFTVENGRFFQLPLTWYRDHGWDFSPGYEINNARFDRLMPDRCVACHASYPRPLPALEGKFVEVRPGIGCERCHGPGALHVRDRTAATRHVGAYDNTIVNPARLPLGRRMEVCEQCHVHTAVTVLRDGKNDFSYMPSQPLRDQFAFYKVSGSIDIVSHADRLRQSKCFLATRTTSRPLECATCHNPHQPPADTLSRNTPCTSCHLPAALAQRLVRSPSLASHTPAANCVSCHMPRVQERAVPHGGFTDHWIRVAAPGSAAPVVGASAEGPIEPYFDRDKVGPDADVYRGMGGIVYATLANSGRALTDATAALDAALGTDTTRADARFLLGVASQQLGRPEEAIRNLEGSVRRDSTRPDRLRALAQAYERAGRAPSTIDALYRRALTVQPALAWIRADYADFLHAQGRRDDARTAYRSALAEQPSLAVTWFNLGCMLAEEGRLAESSAAFQRAVHLDPALAQALSPLLEITTRGKTIVAVRSTRSPLASLPARERGPRDVQMTVATEAGVSAVRFLNIPPRAIVQILKPDGSLVRALPASDGSRSSWNLRTDDGNPIAGGLYRARVLARAMGGGALVPQLFYFGILRRDGE